MKKFLFLLCLLPFLTHADTEVTNITSDTTWSPGNGAYVISSDFTVATGTTLTIEPGTLIRVRANAQSMPTISGTLIARGTEDRPIFFTSIYDDGSSTPATGDWQGISFASGSKGDFDYVTLSYAGMGGVSNFGDQMGLENNGGDIVFDHSRIDHTTIRGIWNKSGSLSVNNSTFMGTGIGIDSGPAMIAGSTFEGNPSFAISDNGTDLLTLTGNTFYDNYRTAQVNAAATFVHESNVSGSTTEVGFEINGIINTDTTWHSHDLPLFVSNLSVDQGAILTLEPGTIVKMGDIFGDGSIEVYGHLIAEGTKNQKIYFTSRNDNSIGSGSGLQMPDKRDWGQLSFEAGSVGNFDNAVIRYAGQNFSGPIPPEVIEQNGGEVTIDNSYIGDSFGSGVYTTAGTTTVSHTEFANLTEGIQSRGGDVMASQSNFHDLSDQAVYNVSGPTIDARNNWWGSKDGPGGISTSTGARINGDVLYQPWVGRDPSLPNPVIVIPGIMGSTLVNADIVVGNEIWPSVAQMLIPGQDVYLDELALDENQIGEFNIQAEGIISSVGGIDFYQGLFEQITGVGFAVDQDVFKLPYDWRLDISQEALLLKQKIDAVKTQTGADKVDLVAHSMGGLLVKEYLKNYGGTSVDKFIDIATPHTGSPKAFKILNFGDNMGFKFAGVSVLNLDTVKAIVQNMPSIYELLPSGEYFDNSNPAYYLFNGLDTNQRLDFDDTKQYLKDQGRNSALVDRADAFHQAIDGLDPASYGVDIYNIVGCGTPTIGQIYVLGQKGDDTEYDIKMINGDGTVPLKSAEAIPASRTYFAKGASHATMPSMSGVKELVASILTGDTNPNISAYPSLSQSESDCPALNGAIVSFHSPITLDAYDASGNHAGLNADGDIEDTIPGADYETIEDNKFVYLPDGGTYTIKGAATSAGSFDVRVESIVNGEVATTTTFDDVPLTSATHTQFLVGPTLPTSLALDANGDGNFEATRQVSSVVAGFVDSINGVPQIATSAVETVTTNLNPQVVLGGSSRHIISTSTLVSVATSSMTVLIPKVAPKKQIAVNKESVVAPSAEPTVSSDISENEVLVYKSIPSTIKLVVKKLWGWFKSRL